MSSAGFRLRPKAERQLLRIYTYTRDSWSEAQAERYLAGLRKAIGHLVRFPSLGTVTYPNSPVRKLVHEQHSIFYRSTPAGIEIGCIFGHGQEFARELAAYEQYALRQGKGEKG